MDNLMALPTDEQWYSLCIFYSYCRDLVIEEMAPAKSAAEKHEVNVGIFCYIFLLDL
jgi:hypothetical protein